jgi:N-acetylglucosamine malate deacetylase 1
MVARLVAAALAALLGSAAAAQEKPERQLRIIVFGAHPDDAELKAGGTAAKWTKLGHAVKMVSVTNGDIGHWKMKGEELARRRLAEVTAADKILGAETEVLPIHDGELEPSLANRKTVTRLIREWKADVVISHRPWDYHPDHRYVGVLVQDAAYMVAVPFADEGSKPLARNPVFLYSSDRFQKPTRSTNWSRSCTRAGRSAARRRRGRSRRTRRSGRSGCGRTRGARGTRRTRRCSATRSTSCTARSGARR